MGASASDWPLFAFASLGGIGYAVVDLMPWLMVGEVVEEDEPATGESHEGIYYGMFMFLRKLAETTVVALALFVLAGLGFTKGEEQDPDAITGIRILTSLVPAFFLALSIWIARSYPLTCAAHAKTFEQLEARDGER